MVKQFNHSLLQILCAYVRYEADWEKFLPLIMFTYHTSVHTSTDPLLILCVDTVLIHCPCQHAMLTIHLYILSRYIHCKLSKHYNFVETHMIDEAHYQQRSYNQSLQQRSFHVGDTVWLDLPTAGKLDPKWEGGWLVKAIPGPVTYMITDGKRNRTVHINRHYKWIQAAPTLSESSDDTPHEVVAVKSTNDCT